MSDIVKMPKLRFKAFSDDWRKLQLKEVCEINPSTNDLPDKFIYIDLESVEMGHLKKKNVLNKDNSPSRAQRLLKKQDLLFQMVRPYQMNNFYFNLDGNYVASTGYAQLRTNEVPEFIYQYLHSNYFVRQVLLRCTGTSYPAINSNDLKNIRIKIPFIQEQQKIADFLTSVDTYIQNLKSQKEALEEYKKGTTQKIFSQEIRFKDEDGKDFPEWKEKKLGEISDVRDGTHQTPTYVKKGVPFYSVEHVTSDNFQDTKFISEEAYEKQNKRVEIEKGDILMTRIGSVGNAKLVDWDVKASFYVSLALIKIQNNVVNSFLLQYIRSSNFQKELWRKTIHVAFPQKINLGEISECNLSLPSLSEQQKIADFLSSIDSLIKSKKTQIEKAEEWKKGLMQQMFV